jgi:hypothetical protein
LLDERLGPVAKERQDRQTVDSETLEAQNQARQFLADYPDAGQHGEVIADQMTKIEAEYASKGLKVSKYVAAEKAYQRLEDFCTKNNFDISLPLGPQLQARERKAPSGVPSPTRQTPRPIPNGSGNGGDVVSRKKQMADADDSFGSIVRESLIEAGYQL